MKMLSFHVKFVQTDGNSKTIFPLPPHPHRSFDTGHKKLVKLKTLTSKPDITTRAVFCYSYGKETGLTFSQMTNFRLF